MKTNRIIISGSRNYNDYYYFEKKVNKMLSTLDKTDLEIVSGCAIGPDTMAIRYAKENNIPIKRFPAEWSKYGKGAGMIRNELMAAYSTHCIAFWDRASRGTENMIIQAKKKDLKLRIVRI